MLKLIVFDLDGVLKTTSGEPHPENELLKKKLSELKANSIILTVASFNQNAEKHLDKAGLLNFFDYILSGYDSIYTVDLRKIAKGSVGYKNKVEMMTKIIKKFNQVEISEIVFLDDQLKNILEVSHFGIKSIETNCDQLLRVLDVIIKSKLK